MAILNTNVWRDFDHAGRSTWLSLGGIAALLLTLLLLSFSAPAQANAACDADHRINVTMPEGSRWEMCWSSDAKSGLVLSNIFYTTANDDGQTPIRRKVLGDARLAQLHVNYDDGSRNVDYVSQIGLGGAKTRTLDRGDCFAPINKLYRDRGRPVVCARVRERGYIYKYYGTGVQGHRLEVFSVHDVGAHTWIQSWLFYEDGTIAPRLGSTGRLERFGRDERYGAKVGRNRIAKSWVYNAFWRLNFDIAGAANDRVQELTVIKGGPDDTRQSLRTRDITRETGRTLEPGRMRSWRIVDTVETTQEENHPISYHLEPQHGGLKFDARSEPWSRYEFYVTANRRCELFVEAIDKSGCGGGIRRYVNGQNVDGADVVVWYGISRHHLPRDEDEPFRSLQWDEFNLIPRDWTDDTPLG